MPLLACLFVLTLVLSGVLTLVAGTAGRRWGVLDHPDTERKFHAQATPRTGGLAIYAAFCAGILLWALAASALPSLPGPGRLTAGMVLSAGLLCAVGAWDDRFGMRAKTKFLWQIAAIIPFVLWGRTAEPLIILGWQIESSLITIPTVLLWLVACCNFINLLDGLDGLAGTLGLIVCLTAGGLAGWQNQPETLVVSCALAGGLVGFLLHNWPPARIFMGDCGSLPLGFLVGALALQASAKKAAGLTLVVPAVLLAVPLVDTAMAILRRKLNGRKIGHGDRGHIHHCLRDRGLSPRQTLLAVAGISLFAAIGAAIATIVSSDLVAVVIGLVLLAALVGGRVFGFQETMLLARHFNAGWSLLQGFPRALRARLVALRLESGTALGELRLWEKIVRRARRMDVVELEFRFEPGSEGRLPTRLHWESDAAPHPEALLWETSGVLTRTTNSRAFFRLRGASPAGNMLSDNAELTELLLALCRYWAEEPSAARETEREPDLRSAAGIDPDSPDVVRLRRSDDDASRADDPRRHREAA